MTDPKTYAKAIVGLVVPLLVFLLGKLGFNASVEFIALVTVVLTPIIVYLIPNSLPEA